MPIIAELYAAEPRQLQYGGRPNVFTARCHASPQQQPAAFMFTTNREFSNIPYILHSYW